MTEHKYLGTCTTISNKLILATNTERLVGNARRWLFIVQRLRYMGTIEQPAVTCHKTCNHPFTNEKNDMDRITKSTSKLSNTALPNLRETFSKSITTKALRMVASSIDPALSLDQLPSGHYCSLRTQISSRSNNSKYVAILNLNRTIFKAKSGSACQTWYNTFLDWGFRQGLFLFFYVFEVNFLAPLTLDNYIYLENAAIKVHSMYMDLSTWVYRKWYQS